MTMLRKSLPIVFILFMFMASACWAMGGAAGEDAPEANHDVSAELSDASGMAARLDQVKIDGRAAFSGSLGNATVTIPFVKVSRAEFMAKGGDFKAVIHLRDGQQIALAMKRSLQLTGQASFGKYRISLGQVIRIRFLP